MKKTGQPQLMNDPKTKLIPETVKERNMKSKIIFLIWGMSLLLAGGVFLAGDNLGGEAQGAAFLFLCALVFTGFVLWKQKNWWAIIPAGVFASLGFVVVLVSLIPREVIIPACPIPLAGVFTPGCCSWGLQPHSGCSGCCARANPPAGRCTRRLAC